MLSYDLPSPIQPKLRNFASCYSWLPSFAIPNEVACDSRRCFKCRSLSVPICRKLANAATGLIGLYPTSRCISKHKMWHLNILARQNSSLLPFTHHNTIVYTLHYHLHTTLSFTHHNTTIYTLQHYHLHTTILPFIHYNIHLKPVAFSSAIFSKLAQYLLCISVRSLLLGPKSMQR